MPLNTISARYIMANAGRFQTLTQFLSLFPKVVKTGDGYNCPCPSHSDKNPSLHVSEHEEKILLHCHGGCTTAAVVAALAITPADLFLSPNGHKPSPVTTVKPKLVKTYDYTDRIGILLFQVCRYEPKDFRQRRPGPEPGTWIYDLKTVTPVLYRLPAIRQAIANGDTIYIVEGEKDADTLSATGVCATTSPMGAGKWRQTYSETLTGATVVVIPDSDAPGIAHGETIRASLAGVAQSVRMLCIPTGRGKDISDWIGAGGTLAGLVELAPTPIATRPAGILLPLCADGETPASDPVMVEEIDGLSLTWGPEHIRCEITRLYQHTNGDVACEVFLTYTLSSDSPRYLLRHHIGDLTNSSAREKLAKTLSKHPGPNWGHMAHQIGEYTLATLRKLPIGESMVHFEETKPPEWILYPFLIRHENNMLFAPGDAGKSYLALYWTILLEAGGLAENPMDWTVNQIEPVTAVLFDWERSRATHAYRFSQLLTGCGLPVTGSPAPFNYHKFHNPLSREVRSAQSLINQYHANFVICDSAGMACGSDMNASQPAIEYFAALGALHAYNGGPLTTLTLAHTAKNIESGKRSAYGNVYWTNEPSSIWEIIPGGSGRMTLHCSKHNDYLGHEDMGVRWQFSHDEGTQYFPCEILNTGGYNHKNWPGIYEALASTSSIKTIEELTGLKYKTVSQELYAMLNAGHVRKIGYGSWGQGEPIV